MSPTWSRTGMALLAFAVALVADLGTKWLILSLVMVPPRVIEVTPVLNLALGFNPGVSFGLLSGAFADRPMLLAGITSFIAAGLLVWAMRSEQPLETRGLGLIAGGATGNLVDRVRQGAVTDFLDFHVGAWHWPAFNMADVAITVGVMLMIVVVVQPRRSPQHSPIANRRSWQDLSLNNLGSGTVQQRRPTSRRTLISALKAAPREALDAEATDPVHGELCPCSRARPGPSLLARLLPHRRRFRTSAVAELSWSGGLGYQALRCPPR